MPTPNASEALAALQQEPERFLDVSGRSGASTWYCPSGGYYLKLWEPGALREEYERLSWFSAQGLAPRPADYRTGDRDVLVTLPLPGRPATDDFFLKEPERLARTLGRLLRRFHALSAEACPFRFDPEAHDADVRRGYEGDAYGDHLVGFCTDLAGVPAGAEAAYRCYRERMSRLRYDTVCHGDYCLPNILLDEAFALTGFLDLGAAGVRDRHYDLFWARWSLWYNLKSDAWWETFLDAYGRDRFDGEAFLATAAGMLFA